MCLSKELSVKVLDHYKKVGGNYSSKRKEIIQAFLASEQPVGAESLWLEMRKNGQVSRASVYNTLNWLVQHAFAFKKQNEDRVWEYFIPQ